MAVRTEFQMRKPTRHAWRSLIPSTALERTSALGSALRIATPGENLPVTRFFDDHSDRILTETMGRNTGPVSGNFLTALKEFRPVNTENEVRPARTQKSPDSADMEHDAAADVIADLSHDTIDDITADLEHDTAADAIDDLCDDAGNDTSVDATADTTAVGYFLGKRPYFYHVKEFAFSAWPGLREVKATTNGIFFFQFKTIAYMEEAIEGGPWLFQGQPIVLQKWEPGMVMRKLKHSQVPVWIKLRHLPVELWTEAGLSTVASGIGKPLYPDAITRACTRLDFARCMCDVGCHAAKDCALNKPSKPIKPPVAVYIPKMGLGRPPPVHDQEIIPPARGVDKQRNGRESPSGGAVRSSREDKGKELVVYNTFNALHLLDDADEMSRGPNHSSPLCGYNFLDFFETRVRGNNAFRIQSILMPKWKWFTDYGSSVADRRALWGTLETKATQCVDIPWLVGGDFNAGLLPLPMQGEWFTWHNHSATPRNLWKRLDRMMINDRWMARFPSASYSTLTPRTSDHSPMVLNGIDNSDLECADYMAAQHYWNTYVFCNMEAQSTEIGLSRTKGGIREDLSHNVQLAKGFLEAAQILVSSNRRDELYIQLEHCCRLVLTKAAKNEQTMLQQRAKMQWMKGGDQCSREEVINEFVTYYQNLLGGERRRTVIDLRFLQPWARHVLTEEEASSLLLPVTPADVKQAVFDIAEDKAPGPDGYSSGFFKAAWPIVGQEVTTAVMDFFNTGRLLKQINTTLLALIPKVHAPMTVSDFRPISCCNVLYKVIAKIIVQRLSVILDKLISPGQAAFVPGRSIGDNIMLAQELFTGYNQSRLPPRCALKVDIRKAYDTVEWDFMIAVMELFGFPSTF
ncbi:UNVERIFIED_CONTAM: hypothetical protein Sindi_3058100, partial [Sesamum indicum]